MAKHGQRALVLACALAWLVAACGNSDGSSSSPASQQDTSTTDVADGGDKTDTVSSDSGKAEDTAKADVSSPQADTQVDQGKDGGVVDAGSDKDAGTSDAGSPPDATPVPDASATDTGPADAGPADTGPPDTGPKDTGPKDTGPKDTGSGVSCGAGTAEFPNFDKSCQNASDCVIVEHQINCCGTKAAWGINAKVLTSFNAAEALCQQQYPKCKCATMPTKADDGNTTLKGGNFEVDCVKGQCWTFVGKS